MKKIIVLCLAAVLAACSSTAQTDNPKEKQAEEKKKEVTAQNALEQLRQKNENVSDVIVFHEENDGNNLLGRPGEYIGKADFSDARIPETFNTEEEKYQYGLHGGTIEVFRSEKDCENRTKYIQSFMRADLGAFGVNQYVYQYDKALFRVSYDITPDQAQVYKEQMDEILGQKGTEIKQAEE